MKLDFFSDVDKHFSFSFRIGEFVYLFFFGFNIIKGQISDFCCVILAKFLRIFRVFSKKL